MRGTACYLAAVLCLTSCGAADPSSQFTAPPATPSAKAQDGHCLTSRATPRVTTKVMRLGTTPLHATLVWVPASDQVPCSTVLTQLNGQAASALASLVNQSPSAPNGVTSCPSDNGLSVDLYFYYAPQSRGPSHATVDLRGCRIIFIDGAQPQWLSPQLFAQLAKFAPKDWRVAFKTF